MLNDNSEQARRERLLAMYGELDEAEIASYLALGWDRPPPTAEEVTRMSPADREATLDDIADRPMLGGEWERAIAEGRVTFGGEIVERNKGGRPRGSGTREQITLRVDRDVIARFRALGDGWQTRINDALRKAAKSL